MAGKNVLCIWGTGLFPLRESLSQSERCAVFPGELFGLLFPWLRGPIPPGAVIAALAATLALGTMVFVYQPSALHALAGSRFSMIPLGPW